MFLEDRDFARSLKLLDTLREEQPTDPVVWLLAGNANAGLGRLHEADGCFTTAIALQPNAYVAYYNRAMCRTQLKEYPLAFADFDQVLALRPDLKCVWLNRALAFEASGNLRQALADLNRAIAGGDVPPRAYLLRSRVRARLGDVKGAEQDRLKGLAEEPTDEIGWIARGFARLQDEPDGALEDYRHALALNPHSQLALENIVHVTADRLALSAEALASLNKLIELDESNASALVGRAVLLARMGRRDDAQTDLNRALKVSSEPTILFQGACCLSLTSNSGIGDGAKGLVMLSRALELEPSLYARAKSDPDLENLRANSEFDELLAKVQELRRLQSKLMHIGGTDQSND
jgi:eukaryotic-like serine/threonine-protein kinase